MHIAISANPPSLDPQSINSNIVGGLGVHIYEPLFAMSENYEPTPVLANLMKSVRMERSIRSNFARV